MTELRQFSGPNAGYVLEQYERFLRDPDSVTEEWRQWFASLQTSPESVVQPAAAPASGDIDRILRVRFLVDEIRRKGHEAATVDPLGFRLVRHEVADPQAYGLSEEDLRSVPARLASPFDAAAEGDAAQLVDRLRRAYCGQTGYQFDHISSDEEHAWLFRAVESATYAADDTEDCKKDLLSRLTEVEAFEKFLHRSFPGQKWFSLEGNDTLVPMLDEVNRQAAFASMDHVVVGMAHRGRLNVLAHVFGQPYEAILADFGEGSYSSETMAEDAASGWMSDVKYHAGARRELDNGGSGELTLILLPNPSHLELVDPVVAGAARAYEDESSDGEGDAAMAVLCHGDSAFAGQGVVAETLNMSRLPGYTSGGTIHIVVNNQIGFTTEPHESYSTMYATDYARGYDIPVIHVNADDVQACIAASRLAFAYRQRYHKDIVIDHVGYRRYGHNEGDEPSFTQPRMYEKIGGHPSPRALLAQKVAGEGILSDEEADQLFREKMDRLNKASTEPASAPGSVHVPGPAMRDRRNGAGKDDSTRIEDMDLVAINEALHELPEGFNLNRKLNRPFSRRREALQGDGKIDWGHAEALALGSILRAGISVRLTGQDTARGTFSHRHAVVHDEQTGDTLVPLQQVAGEAARFWVYNTPLSEVAALGFEYGYSLAAPEKLVLWEAQFGDFVNNAQSVIDEYLVSARAKWGSTSGLVLLLPHGSEGQGPDHSDAHLHRFLQLAAEDNMRVVYPSTAGQYFHLLRRQADLITSDPRPLVVMTGKSLLRHPMAAADQEELVSGRFQPVLDDSQASRDPDNVRRVLLCSGRVYVDLQGSDERAAAADTAIVRLEELYPFPHEELSVILRQYRHATDIVWVQEEPANRGCWSFVRHRIAKLLGEKTELRYVGRAERPSPAVGMPARHKAEQQNIVQTAFAQKTEAPVSAGRRGRK